VVGLALSVEQRFAAPPETVFDLFGAGAGAGWVFDAFCDRVAVGAFVTFRVPLGAADLDPVELLGRIVAVRAPSRIEVVHHQPWQGRLRVQIDPDGPGRSRVRLIADLDDTGLAWLMRRRGHSVAETAPANEHRVGLLTSKSGPGSVFAVATEYLATMAIDEINADGGVGGRQLNLIVGDDATDPQLGVLEARRLVASGCRVVIASTTSATFRRAAAELRSSGVLLIHSPMNEGGHDGETLVRLGERPYCQLRAAVGPVMREAGAGRWFLAGNAYVWPKAVHRAARLVLAEHGGTVVGEAFEPLGTRDFTPLVARILDSDADVVLSSFVGADLVAFERQCHAMGVRERCRTLAPALDEPTLELIGVKAAAGMWGVAKYFAALSNDHNAAFLRRYQQQFGRFAPPVSSISQSVYEAVYRYADAVRQVGDGGQRAIVRTLQAGRSSSPRAPESLGGHKPVRQQLYLARATDAGFAVTSAR